MDSPESSEPLQDTLTKLSQQTSFQPIQFLFSPRDAFSTLPSSLRKADILEPAQVFELFFTSEVISNTPMPTRILRMSTRKIRPGNFQVVYGRISQRAS